MPRTTIFLQQVFNIDMKQIKACLQEPVVCEEIEGQVNLISQNKRLIFGFSNKKENGFLTISSDYTASELYGILTPQFFSISGLIQILKGTELDIAEEALWFDSLQKLSVTRKTEIVESIFTKKPIFAYLTSNDLASNSQLRYLAEAPIQQELRVYYSTDIAIQSQLKKALEQGNWLKFASNKYAAHHALGAFKENLITYWDYVSFVTLCNLIKSFDNRSPLIEVFSQYRVLVKNNKDTVSWSLPAHNFLLPRYRILLKAQLEKENQSILDDVIEEKLEELKDFIDKNCPKNQQVFFEFNPEYFNLIPGHQNLSSEKVSIFYIIMKMQGANESIEIPMSNHSSLTQPYFLRRLVQEFIYSKDAVISLPKLGALGSEYFYTSDEHNKAFGVLSSRPSDLEHDKLVTGFMYPHGKESTSFAVSAHDDWHAANDSNIPKKLRIFIKKMAFVLKMQVHEKNNLHIQYVESELLDFFICYKEDFAKAFFDRFLNSNVADVCLGVLIIFYDIACHSQNWIEETNFKPLSDTFPLAQSEEFPHFTLLIRNMMEISKQSFKFEETCMQGLLKTSIRLLDGDLSDNKILNSLLALANLLLSLKERLGNLNIEIENIAQNLKLIKSQNIQSVKQDLRTLLEQIPEYLIEVSL